MENELDANTEPRRLNETKPATAPEQSAEVRDDADVAPTVPLSADPSLERVRTAEQQVAAEWKVGDVILDLYEVKEIHYGGGMGLIYRVHHRNWNIDLAVKSPRPQYFQT